MMKRFTALASLPLLIAFAYLVAGAVLPVVTLAQTEMEANLQLDLGFDTDLTLELAPAHPSPGEAVRVTAHSTLLDLSGATITWFANGKKIAEGVGLSVIDTVAGPSGSVSTIEARINDSGKEIAAKAGVRPTEIDLLWESDSYVPPLYRGRALPSAGTNLRLQALPRFKRSDGSLIPTKDITFTWRKNDYVVASASGRGKSTAFLPSPPLFGTDVISVEAKTSDGAFAGEASVRIPSTEPLLTLYADHPLFGIMYHQALGAQNFLSDVEMSFAAVPYYAEAISPNDNRLIYEWRVNGTALQNATAHPSEITINASNSSGAAFVELALTHSMNFFMSAADKWRITLLGNTGPGLPGDPFRGNQ